MAVLAKIVNPMVQPSIVTIAMKGTTSSSSIALTHILEWLSLSLSLSLSLTHIYGDFYNVGIGRKTYGWGLISPSQSGEATFVVKKLLGCLNL